MFRKAERRQAKLRLALCGPSGSGKTFSALQIAQGIGGKVALIDTENGSGDLYADLYDYDIARLTSFSPKSYITAINAAEKAGYDVLIIDSLSHAWAGKDGILDQVDKAAKASSNNNSFSAWRHITPEHNNLVDTILQSNLHIIVTMRTKTAYEITEDSRGKMRPSKIGLAPIQKEGMEYEFTVVLDLSIDGHIATSSKDRTGIFDGQYITPTRETGTQILEWLNSGLTENEALEKELSQHIQNIKNAENLDDLQSEFAKAWKAWKEDEDTKEKLKSQYELCKEKFITTPSNNISI